MANILGKIAEIRDALFGKDVRENIASGIEAINSEVESTTSRQAFLETQFDEQINNMSLQDPQSAETVDIRIAANGTTYTKAGDHVRALGSQIADIKNKQLKFVTYDMFGAVGDGVYDDGIAIKNCHDFANANNLPVINLIGEYWIKNTWNIEVKTNVIWGYSKFNIKESDKGTNYVFKILSKETSTTISDLSSFQNKFKKGITHISELTSYEGCLLHVKDTSTTWMVRTGGQVYTLEDCVVVEKGGYLTGECARDILTPNSITVYPLDKDYLTIEGGNIQLTGDSSLAGQYLGGLIYVNRSRVVIDKVYSNVISDTSTAYANGIFQIDRCFDVTIKNIKLTPRITTTGTGTYAITFVNVVKLILENINAHHHNNGTITYWGAIDGNFVKDMYVYNCHMNRVDCHVGAYNVTIKDSTIGEDFIKMSGGGKLTIENTTVNRKAIILRVDYGSRWDGDIIIKNLKVLMADDTTAGTLIEFSVSDLVSHDFVYECMMCNELYIDGVTFDYTSNPNNTANCWLLYAPANNISSALEERRQYKLPKKITIKNVKTIGRDSNTRLMMINNSNVYRGGGSDFVYLPLDGNSEPKKDAYITDFLHNSELMFENIELKKIDVGDVYGEAHINFSANDGNSSRYLTKKCFVPKITIKNCDNVRCAINGAVAKTIIKDSIVEMYTSYNGANRAIGRLINCILKPKLVNGISRAFRLNNANSEILGTKIEPVEINGVIDINNIYAYEFMQNESISCKSAGSYLDTRFYVSTISYMVYVWRLMGGFTCNPIIDSTATDVAGIVANFNSLLVELRKNGVIK